MDVWKKAVFRECRSADRSAVISPTAATTLAPSTHLRFNLMKFPLSPSLPTPHLLSLVSFSPCSHLSLVLSPPATVFHHFLSSNKPDALHLVTTLPHILSLPPQTPAPFISNHFNPGRRSQSHTFLRKRQHIKAILNPFNVRLSIAATLSV